MNTEIEIRLRRLFEERAQEIQQEDLPTRSPDDVRVVALTDGAESRRPGATFAAAAVLLLVLAAITAGLVVRDNDAVTSNPPAAPPSRLTSSTARAWPLTADAPLPAAVAPERIATPEIAAQSYLAEVVGHEGWPLESVSSAGTRAVARYVLQDVPGEIALAQTEDGLWYVTGASTDFLRPTEPLSTPQGLDLSVAPGPRLYEAGSPIRVSAAAADGRILARADARVMAVRNDAAGAAAVVPVRWAEAELAAAVRVDVLDDHDGNPDTPNVVIGHWATGVAPPALGGLPAGFDPATADSVFTATGSVDEAAGAYLRTRFPDYPAPQVEAQRARTRAGRAYVRWSTGGDTGSMATGTLLLRPADGGWEVLASTTDGIDLSDLRVEEGSVRGEVRSTEANSLFADVLRGDGTPVAGSARPGGYGDADYSFGSAAGPSDGTLRLDVATDEPAPIVRVNTVGGTILSVSEVRVSPLG